MNGTLFNELLASVKEAGTIKRNEVLPSREMELKMDTEETQVRSECPFKKTVSDNDAYKYFCSYFDTVIIYKGDPVCISPVGRCFFKWIEKEDKGSKNGY